MQATVISVVPAKLKGKWDGYEFTYQGDPYQGNAKKPTTRFVFKNDTKNPAVPGAVKNLEAGQRVDLTFEKNGNFSNLVGVAVLGDSPPARASNTQAPTKSYNKPKDDETPIRIARAVALKAAIDAQGTMVDGGAKIVKATMKENVFGDQSLALAKQFEKYLSLDDSEESLNAVLDSVDNEIPFDQETFES